MFEKFRTSVSVNLDNVYNWSIGVYNKYIAGDLNGGLPWRIGATLA